MPGAPPRASTSRPESSARGDLAAGRGIGAGLELGVGGKGLAAFLDVEIKAQRGRRNDLDIGKQGADFAQLAGVVRGQKQRHCGYWGGLSSSDEFARRVSL